MPRLLKVLPANSTVQKLAIYLLNVPLAFRRALCVIRLISTIPRQSAREPPPPTPLANWHVAKTTLAATATPEVR